MKPTNATRLTVVPVTLPVANAYVSRWHRHHAPIPAGFVWFCMAVVSEEVVVGVGIAGRPTNRNNDDGQTVEVVRVATNGHPNACSALYGAAARAAQAIGAWRILTYTLDEETGASLRGSGWDRQADGIGSSWMKGTSRRTAIARPHMDMKKTRWAREFRQGPVAMEIDYEDAASTPTLGLETA